MDKILWTLPWSGAVYAHVRSSVFNAANLTSHHVIFPLIKLWQVLYCKKTVTVTLVMKLWHNVLFLNHFHRFHVILSAQKICKCTFPAATGNSSLLFSSHSCIPSSLNHKSDRRVDQLRWTSRDTPPQNENVVIIHLPPCRSEPIKALLVFGTQFKIFRMRTSRLATVPLTAK